MATTFTIPRSRMMSRSREMHRGIVIRAEHQPRDGYAGGSGQSRFPSVSLDVRTPDHATAGFVLLRTLLCGICGTDWHMVQTDADGFVRFSGPVARLDRGIVLGHEGVFQVVECGPGVELEPGTLVTADSLIPCRRNECITCNAGHFNYCPRAFLIGLERDGVFADFCTLPATALHRVDGLIAARGLDTALRLATMAEPIGVVLNIINEAEKAGYERTALIYGGGPIGTLAAAAARWRGFYPVVLVEPNDKRRALASRFADYTCHPDDICSELFQNAFGDDGPSAIIDACGELDFQQAAERLAPYGQTLLAARTGKPVSGACDTLMTGGKAIRGVRGHVGFLPRALKMLADPRLTDLCSIITRELHGLEELRDALRQPGAFADDMKVICNVADDQITVQQQRQPAAIP
jgi:hypothetical protein